MEKLVYNPPELQQLLVRAEEGYATSHDQSFLEEIYGETEGEW